ncbi:MAG: 4Fe-4S dicluster domain-containing protein [Chloroflexi bacterium]|nr:4Fe-4S dicluster domain-containing protein [Chloroflexota bacterium]
MQLAFYFDQTRCHGCYACVVACKDWHDVPAGPASWRRVITIERGVFPTPLVAFLTTSCYHCADPACASACPANAIRKRQQDGVVVVNKDACVGGGCRLCLDACPYGAPQFAGGNDAKLQMCNFCVDRWHVGQKPLCVNSCPTRALDSGPIDELRRRYGETREAVGFSYDEKLKPSVLFKPKSLDAPPVQGEAAGEGRWRK